ncbi:HAD hydrolase-like protein [Leptolyngbya sp. FACHB-261]|nr:HAD hydrolase-like protein [Leptolyngbya sp. FACHB-261]
MPNLEECDFSYRPIANGDIKLNADLSSWASWQLAQKKKPLPFSFCAALDRMQLSCHQVMVVSDSRHTDALEAWLSGWRSIQVATLPHP